MVLNLLNVITLDHFSSFHMYIEFLISPVLYVNCYIEGHICVFEGNFAHINFQVRIYWLIFIKEADMFLTISVSVNIISSCKFKFKRLNIN